MNSFRAGLMNELMLLVYRRKTIMFLAVTVLMPIVFLYSLKALQPVLGLGVASGTFPIELLAFGTLLWIPLFLAMTAADMFPHELSERTRKLGLLRPISRFRLYAAKVTALGIGLAVLLIVLGVCSIICGRLAEPSAGYGFGEPVKAYFAAFLSMLALEAVFVFIAQFFKNATGYLIVAILLYAAAKLGPYLFEPLTYFSPASYTDWHVLWLNPNVSIGHLLQTGIFLLASFVFFFSIGYWVFDRKDV